MASIRRAIEAGSLNQFSEKFYAAQARGV
jgi:queuine/archaeosine tRNA-ribosyltransferase